MRRFPLTLALLCALLTPGTALAQLRGWADLNLGLSAPAEDGYTARFEPVLFDEPAVFESSYAFTGGMSFDLGAGYMVTPRIGAGAAIGRVNRKGPASAFIEVPDPRIFDNIASDSETTDQDLERIERVVHLHAMVMLKQTPRLRVRAFGGPSRFFITQHTIDIGYAHVFSGATHIVQIRSLDATPTKGGGWGVHGGADVSYFFGRSVGVGGFFRISRGTADLDDLGGAFVSEVTLGGADVGVGIRTLF